MSLTGKYEGKLIYGDLYPDDQIGAELTFQIELNEENNSFVGVSHDLEGPGKSPDEAEVAGMINESVISFEKTYRRRHYCDGNGNTVIDKKRKGLPILYNGIFNAETGFYEGDWKYNVVRRFLYIFSWPIEIGAGTFRMRKIEN